MGMREAKKKDFEGKTIKKIDLSASNAWRITFSDNSSIEIWAECGSGRFDTPCLLVDEDNNFKK